MFMQTKTTVTKKEKKELTSRPKSSCTSWDNADKNNYITKRGNCVCIRVCMFP